MAAVGNERAGQRIQNGGRQREGIICGQYKQSMDKRPVWCWDLAQRRSWWGDKWEGKRRSHQEGKIETHTPKGAKADLVNVCWCSTGQNKSQEWVNSRNSISRSDAEGTNTRSQRMWELGDLKNLPDDFFFSQHGFYSAVHTCNMSLPPNPTESQKHSLAHVPTAIVLTQTTYWFPQWRTARLDGLASTTY